jgi:hypothetical protein
MPSPPPPRSSELRTTLAVHDSDRRRIRTIAAALDLGPADVVHAAVDLYVAQLPEQQRTALDGLASVRTIAGELACPDSESRTPTSAGSSPSTSEALNARPDEVLP